MTIFEAQLTFALAQSIFGPFEDLTEQTSSQGLKFDMDDLENILGHWGEIEVIWTQRS